MSFPSSGVRSESGKYLQQTTTSTFAQYLTPSSRNSGDSTHSPGLKKAGAGLPLELENQEIEVTMSRNRLTIVASLMAVCFLAWVSAFGDD